jgi:Phosphate-selective porin O and P
MRSVLGALIVGLVWNGATAAEEGPRVAFNGLLQVWYVQALDEPLRLGDALVPPNRYYNLRPEFRESGFDLRRAELKVTARPLPAVDLEVMIDPSLATVSVSHILQDAAITVRGPRRFELKAGQFKTGQTYEGLLNSGGLVFAERGQITRVFGDVRDRGAMLAWRFGRDPKLSGRLSGGVFNGAGKFADENAGKDVVGRAEMRKGVHRFGAYGLLGHSYLADSPVALTLAGAAPSPHDVLAHDDLTWHVGAFYVLEGTRWFASAEFLSGELGRRFPTLGVAAGPALREHLSQHIAGLVLTAAHTRGRHTLSARYDVADYNAGDRWYTEYDPYRESGPGVSQGADYTPRFTEVTLGYTFAWRAREPRLANVKLNYVARSKNFLRPREGETGAQGGDSLVLALQASF